MMAASPKNEAAAKKFLGYLGTPQAEDTYVKSDPTVIAVNTRADTSGYSKLQKKAVDFVGNAKQISQFLDRDTRPGTRLDGDDPGAAAVHQGTQRHRRAHQEHREPEEVDLHQLT